MSKIANLLDIMMILQYKELTTASELSEMLNVDKKTVYRYIDSLSKANVPVHTRKGRYGGFYIDKDFYIKSADLNYRELKALLMASAVFTERAGFAYERDLKNAVHKIKNLYVNKNMNFDSIDNTGIFSMNSIGNTENLENKIHKINFSMLKGRSLSINYFSINKNDLTAMKVDPYDLIFKEGIWYIIGYCHMKDDIESFQLDRIRTLEINDDIYMRPHTFSLEDYLEHNSQIFAGDKIKIVIKFDKSMADFIQNTKWHVNQTIEKLQDGSLLFRLYINDIKDIEQWVLGFGKNAEVIEPKELKENIKLEIEELYKKYYNF